MELETRIDSLEKRVAALEDQQPKPRNTPETNPFMGRAPQSDPPKSVSEDFLKVFGRVRVNGEGRVLDKWEENTWNRRLKSWGGVALNPLQSDAIDALLDTWEITHGTELKPECIIYGGELALVFPGIVGLGYGTPNCYVVAVSLIEKDFGLERKIDRVIELIEQRMAK